MEKKWWYDGNENEGCVAWKAKMDYDGGCCSLRMLGTLVDFLCAGTFRLIISSASLLSAWKSG